MENGPLFPLWQPDQQEYKAVCAYLGISPRAELYAKLLDYLGKAPFRFARPRGFALDLAKLKLTEFRIARLDLASKVFYSAHPIRQLLNAVIALHECDGRGYAELSATTTGWRLLPAMLGWGVQFAGSALITMAWLCWRFVIYGLSRPLRLNEDLSGKRILITGVNRGLGRDLLLQALEQGAEVVGTVRTREALDSLREQLPQEAPVVLLIADLSRTGSLTNALQEGQITAERVDIALSCAGTKYSGISVTNFDELRATFEVNYFSNVELARWLYEAVHEARLVLISSMGRWHGMHSSCGYNASKAALSIWGESLDMELHRSKKGAGSVMVVEPGLFASGMMEPNGLNRLLLASRRTLAARILSAAQQGRKTLRFPFWFAVVTWVVCLGGRGFRYRLFARVGK